MAEYVSMKQVPGGTVTAVDDRILNDINLSNGKIYGCDVAYIGNNMIHINAGYGIIKGGLFEIEDHTEYVEYAESEPTTGQIYLKFDASATDKLVIVKETTADLHVLVQNEDANFESGVYEIPICSFVATTTALENVVETWPTASGAMETLATMEALMANTTPGKVADALLTKQINTNLVKKISDDEYATPYVTVDGIGYDETNKKLMLKVNGADTVIPFNGGIDVTKFKYVNGTQNARANFNFTADGEIILVIFFTKYNGNTTSYTLSLYDIVNNKYCSNTNILTDGLGNLTVSGNSGYLYNNGNFNQNVWGFIFYK